MRLMLVLADDLSGAADCGVACASHGLSAVVLLSDRDTDTGIDADVLTIDCNTRNQPPAKAASEVTRLVERHLRNEDLLFKKLDSTLRGNVAAELAAALEARRMISADHPVVAVLAPAFPANGRTTSNGRQLVHGRPLEETEIWQREPTPARSHIPEILHEAGLRSALIPLHAIRSDRSELQSTMTRLAETADVLVCDAETEEDLRTIAAASMVLSPRTVWAGSAGLAYHLRLAAGFKPATVSAPSQPFATGPTLFVIGSLSSISREQAKLLAAAPGLVSICISPNVLMQGKQSPEWRRHQLTLHNALHAGSDVAISLAAEHRIENEKGPLLTAALGQLAAQCAGRIGALVATGGESARSVLDAWGVTRLRILGELEPGLPLSITENWTRPLPVLTKAGGFGTPQTLLHCRQFLRNLDRSSAANFCPIRRSPVPESCS
jgi:D-threonate/D-erythronate kinase